MKYSIALNDITKLSISSQGDHTVVFHVPRSESDKSSKGDHIFIIDQLVELITRVYMAFHAKLNTYMDVNFSDSFMVNIDAKGATRFAFHDTASEEVGIVHYCSALVFITSIYRYQSPRKEGNMML